MTLKGGPESTFFLFVRRGANINLKGTRVSCKTGYCNLFKNFKK
jgi:hypothetical protein